MVHPATVHEVHGVIAVEAEIKLDMLSLLNSNGSARLSLQDRWRQLITCLPHDVLHCLKCFVHEGHDGTCIALRAAESQLHMELSKDVSPV